MRRDALGRLTDAWEITAADSATEAVSFPGHSFTAGYRTKYAYDALDDLVSVTQRMGTSGTTQTRSFAYDSLKRLTSATNPESGTIAINATTTATSLGKWMHAESIYRLGLRRSESEHDGQLL